MNDRSLRASCLLAAATAFLALQAIVAGQSGEDLVEQMRGKAESPARSAEQMADAYQKAIDYLLPLMSAEAVSSRYPYQIALQDMGSYAARPGGEGEREVLAKVMIKTVEQATMPKEVRYWFVLQLERMGRGESVPCLAKLMQAEDPILRDYGRRALEKNPDPIATEALLKTLSNAKEQTWRIGLMNSLGVRRAESAIGPVSQALADPDAKVAAAAAVTVGRIGGAQGVKVLQAVLDRPAGPASAAAAEGLIAIAQDRAGRQDAAGAGELFWIVYQKAAQPASGLPASMRPAAITGLILCNSDKGMSQIEAWIRDSDPKVRAAVVQASRNTASKAPTQMLARLLPGLSPDAQVQVLALIGDQRDTASSERAKELLASSDEAVCLAAVDALTKLGTETAATALLQTAAGRSGAVQKAAQAGLGLLQGAAVEPIIKTQAASGEAKLRVAAILALGQRRTAGVNKVLLGYAAEQDDKIVAASFQALVEVVDANDLPVLVDLVAKTKAGREQGMSAIRAALSRAKDRDAAAQVVIDRAAKADVQARSSLLTCLSRGGGQTAFKALVEATLSSDAVLREAGIRALSDWPDFEAAQPLLTIARNPQTALNEYVLATRGALNLVTTIKTAPVEERETLCLSAFENARRSEEKRLAIAAMAQVPTAKIAERLLGLAQEGEFKTEAGLAALGGAELMLRTEPSAARDLAAKIRALNLSEEVNRRADGMLRGGMRGRRRSG
jgi:HEAT repeat protein